MTWRIVILWLLTIASAVVDLPRHFGVSYSSFYAYDAANNLQFRTNNALVQTFIVDGLNQLSNITRSGTFTVTGSLPAPPSSVTVNGANAQTNADFTFAAPGNTLNNSGNTSFTIITKNAYGVATTNNLSINLPQTVSFQYDANGNLTNDGTRIFFYDSANRLIGVSNTTWQSWFVYDGLGRRRIESNANWTGSTWAATNVARFIYDGMQAIQEQDTNGNVLATYTRGLDLSGSLAGAGGIGGLLARTDPSGSYFYHADGNGNITALMDNGQNIVARYEYDPFGRMIGKWGALADANRYRFSSKEFVAQAGIYYYGFRFYEPNFQRWLNRDPVNEAGSINLYCFVGNNAANYLDPQGLYWSIFGLGFGQTATYLTASGQLGYGTPPSERPQSNHPDYSTVAMLAAEGGGGITTVTDANGNGPGDLLQNTLTGAGENILGMALGGPEDKSLYDAATDALSAASKSAKAAKMCKGPIRFHHSWPKYLGGPPEQILEPLPKALHDAYHAGLDQVLPRQAGADTYGALGPEAQTEALQILKAYTQAFDATYGTQLYDAMVREGFMH